ERPIKSVLVIGGDGYIGSALLPKMLAKGYRVRVLSLLLYGTDSIKHLLNHPHLEVIQADFRQVDKVVEAMRDMDAVVHLGAFVVDGEITVVGGNQWRPFVHVDDAALAVLKVLEAPLGLVRNQVFNVGSDDQNYTILQVAQLIHRWVPTARLLTYASQSDRRNYRV